MFLSPFAAGDKCSGPCAHGYRCPPSCKDLTKEIKKMHDDSHTYSHCYCSHCGTIYCQTLEQEQVTSRERINSCDFSYVETWFAVLTFQRYLETVKKTILRRAVLPRVSLLIFWLHIWIPRPCFFVISILVQNMYDQYNQHSIYQTSFIFICCSGT